MIYKSFQEMIGSTPMVRYNVKEPGNVEIYVKLEGANPTSSVKDRNAWALIKNAIETQKDIEGKELIATTSGNFGCGVAFYAYLFGFKAIIVTGKTLTEDKAFFIDYFNAKRISQNGRTYDGHKMIVNEILPREPDKYYYLDQLHSMENPKIHYETTGPEILNDIPDVKCVAFSIGSGATMMGVGKYLKEKNPKIQIIASIGDKGTKIPGTGPFIDGEYKTPFYYECFKNNWVDKTYPVSEEQAKFRVQQLKQQGFFVGIQTGGVLEAAIRGIEEMKIEGKVVVISGDSGWKNVDKLRSLL